MMDYRQAVLNGSRGASEALSQLGLKAKIREGLQQVDIFEALHQLDVTTLCRPLEGLLGAFTTNGSECGILVSTRRRLPIQRFTAAHELGHFWLNHEHSIDSPATIDKARSNNHGPLQEVEAEAFASAFMIPKALIKYTAQRQNYSKADLKNPDVVYQLSLRLGVSYSATRVALANYGIITHIDSEHIKAVAPKLIKQRLLKEYGVTASDPDVFYLTEKDCDSYMMSGANDVMILDLPSHAAAGYMWEQENDTSLLSTISDFNVSENTEKVGGVRRLKKVFTGLERAELSMFETRPWEPNGEALSQFKITLDFRGKENGLPRAFRQ